MRYKTKLILTWIGANLLIAAWSVIVFVYFVHPIPFPLLALVIITITYNGMCWMSWKENKIRVRHEEMAAAIDWAEQNEAQEEHRTYVRPLPPRLGTIRRQK